MDPLKKKKLKEFEERINQQLNAFRDKFGEEPAFPVFFDLEGEAPMPYNTETFRQKVAETAMENGEHPTGVLVRFGFPVTTAKA